jgi:hypothetical protein
MGKSIALYYLVLVEVSKRKSTNTFLNSSIQNRNNQLIKRNHLKSEWLFPIDKNT